MRTLNSTAQAEILKKLGTEPITVVEIFWKETSTIYADKDLSWADGKIKTISDLDEVIRLDSKGTSAGVEVELIDADGTFKALFDTIDLHKRPCHIYQTYQGLSKEDSFLLLEGEVLSPIVWNEADRTIKFEVYNQLISNEVGFSPESGQLPNSVSPFAIGKPWPLCFGKPVHVPATKIDEVIVGSNATYYLIPDPTLEIKQLVIDTRLRQIGDYSLMVQQSFVQESVFGIDPANVHSQYISAILQEDDAKQRREDLTREIQDLKDEIQELEDLAAEAETDEVRDPILEEVEQKEGELEGKESEMEGILEDLADALYEKQILEIDADNAEFEFNMIGELRQYLSRLLSETAKLMTEWYILRDVRRTVEKSKVDGFTVIGHDRFDQGPLDLIVNGVKMHGVLTGNYFKVNKILPQFTNIEITGYPDAESFTIADSSVDLTGLYCYMESGLIFRVREQVGLTCFVDSIPLKRIDSRGSQQADEIPPLASDLSFQTWEQLEGASEHTKGERQHMLETAVMESSVGGEIADTKNKINQLSELASSTQVKEVFDEVNKSIKSNTSYFNKLVSSVQIPGDVQAEANAQISEGEFELLLRMENLSYAEDVRQFTPIRGNGPEAELLYFKAEMLKPGKRARKNTFISQASSIILPEWMNVYRHYARNLNFGYGFNSGGFYNPVYYLPDIDYWIAQPGSSVKDNSDYQEKYVANILPSEVKAVYAHRGVDGVRQLFPVPPSYYSVNPSENYGDVVLQDETTKPLNATTISLKRPLSEYSDEGWESDSLFVTLSSSVGSNVCDIITHLLETYSNVSVDLDTFNSVRSKLEPFPANFAMLDRRDVLTLVDEIAWQARCRVDVFNGVAKIVYLPELPESVRVFTEKHIEFGSLQIETSETEDIVTKLIAEWRPHYELEEPTQEIVRFNIKKYGVQERRFDFFIYNNQDLVQHAATFWSMRMANVWKKVSFKTFLTNLDLQTSDAVTLYLENPYFAHGPVTALIDSLAYNPNDQSITVRVELPIRLGEMTQFEHYWPANIETIYPIIQDIAAGYAGDPFHLFIVRKSSFSINPEIPTGPEISGRPRDYGSINMSDTADLRIDSVYDSILTLAPGPSFSGKHSPKSQVRDHYTPEEPQNYNDTSDSNESETRKKIKEGSLPTDSFIGRVISKQGGKNIYLVTKPNGTQVKVKQMRIHKDSEIPKGTQVTVVYNKDSAEYNMQAPVWGKIQDDE